MKAIARAIVTILGSALILGLYIGSYFIPSTASTIGLEVFASIGCMSLVVLYITWLWK